jgi:hypothetical protein
MVRPLNVLCFKSLFSDKLLGENIAIYKKKQLGMDYVAFSVKVPVITRPYTMIDLFVAVT